jgi:hypothetical protein
MCLCQLLGQCAHVRSGEGYLEDSFFEHSFFTNLNNGEYELIIAYCNHQILKLVHDPQARCVVQYSFSRLL